MLNSEFSSWNTRADSGFVRPLTFVLASVRGGEENARFSFTNFAEAERDRNGKLVSEAVVATVCQDVHGPCGRSRPSSEIRLQPNACWSLCSGSNATGNEMWRRCANACTRSGVSPASVRADEHEFDVALSLQIGANTLQFRQLGNTWRTPRGKKIEHENLAGHCGSRHGSIANGLQRESWRLAFLTR